tara:strand:- start:12930 stop:13169 length:240 start_codon:yes stop_codon:yes gene_type:complete
MSPLFLVVHAIDGSRHIVNIANILSVSPCKEGFFVRFQKPIGDYENSVSFEGMTITNGKDVISRLPSYITDLMEAICQK